MVAEKEKLEQPPFKGSLPSLNNQKLNMYCKQLKLEKLLGLTPKRSFDDIAQELGISKQSARKTYIRGLEKLAQIILEDRKSVV